MVTNHTRLNFDVIQLLGRSRAPQPHVPERVSRAPEQLALITSPDHPAKRRRNRRTEAFRLG